MSLIWMEKDVGFLLNMRDCLPFASSVEKLDMMKSIVGQREATIGTAIWRVNECRGFSERYK